MRTMGDVGDAYEAAKRRAAESAAILEEQEVATKARGRQELQKLANFTPIGDRVVVQVNRKEKSDGGVILPENMKQRPTTGVVVAVGPECKVLKVGRQVLFMRYAGVEIELPSGEKLEQHKVLRENECFGHWPDDDQA